jgi:hypothetical protein
LGERELVRYAYTVIAGLTEREFAASPVKIFIWLSLWIGRELL